MHKFAKLVVVVIGTLAFAPTDKLDAADPPQSAIENGVASDKDKDASRPDVLIIGASSLNSPVGQTQFVGAMLESQGIRMHIDGAFPKLDALSEVLRAKKEWDTEHLGGLRDLHVFI